jgi:hypothetical protein
MSVKTSKQARQEARDQANAQANNGESPPPGNDSNTARDGEAIYEEVDPHHMENVTDDLDPESPFPIDALKFTRALIALVKDVALALDIPHLLPAACALGVLSAALGRGLKLLTSKGRLYGNLFFLLGAESGTGKSLAYDRATLPLDEIQEELDEAFKKVKKQLKTRLGLVKNTITAILSNHLKMEKAGESMTATQEAEMNARLESLHEEQEALELQLVSPPSISTSDVTSEALGFRLSTNREQLALLSDEGGILLQDLEGKYNAGNTSDDMLLCKAFTANSHTVDRISREKIYLKQPCVALLILLQPDLLQRAFDNERFRVGGFLARCMSADAKLEMKKVDEDVEDEPTFDDTITKEWATLVKEIYAKYHEAKTPFILSASPEAKRAARRMRNKVVEKATGLGADIRNFAARWVEIAWKNAVDLHAARYGTDSEHHLLSEETFNAAAEISWFFAKLQLDVLDRPRAEQREKVHAKLQELFLLNGCLPITFRALAKRHRISRGQVATCVAEYPEIYKIVTVKKRTGGSPSTILCLIKHLPKGMRTK